MNRTASNPRAAALFAASVAILLAVSPRPSAGMAVAGREDKVGTIANVISGCFDQYTHQISTGSQIWVDIDAGSYLSPTSYCLELIAPNGAVIDSDVGGADFGGDASLVVIAPATGTYRFRVSIDDGSCGDLGYNACAPPGGEPRAFYLLNLSIRALAVDGPLTTAVVKSVNTAK